jgi:hypothetical protein
VKPAGISEKNEGILKDKINELAKSNKKKYIRDLYKK